MREIKFRAWDVRNSRMIYYGAFQFEQIPWLLLKPSEIKPLVFPFEGMESDRMVTENPLDAWYTMQYTGLKDKNGKEIYEGDIVTGHTSYENSNDEYEWTKENPCVVEWFEYGFYPFTLNSRWRCDVVEIEIIGNIYERG